jgi:hypothetical protein
MTLDTYHRFACLRTGERKNYSQDHSLTYALCLILFIVFTPIIGAHVVFVLITEATHVRVPQAQNTTLSGAAR